MKTFVLIVSVIGFCLYVFKYYCKQFENPYLIEYYVGVRGAGKSTLATKEAIEFQKKGFKVYANFEVFGAYRIDPADIGFYRVPPNSLLLLDEVSLIWSNRDFKNFPREVEAFFRYVRKYHVYTRMYSQNFDVDAKVRGLVDSIYILIKILNVFTIAKKVKRTIVLHGSTKDEDSGQRTSEGFISENFSYDLPSTWKVCFIPRWIKFFNSFEAPELPSKEFYKFQFVNEPYMYGLTHYKGYKIDQIKQLYHWLRKQYIIYKYAFGIEYEDLINLNNYV